MQVQRWCRGAGAEVVPLRWCRDAGAQRWAQVLQTADKVIDSAEVIVQVVIVQAHSGTEVEQIRCREDAEKVQTCRGAKQLQSRCRAGAGQVQRCCRGGGEEVQV